MGKSIVVAGYVPIDGEVNIIPLMKSLHDLGHIILAPIDSQVGCFSLWRDVIRGSQLVDDYIFNSSCVVEGEPMFGGVIAAPYMHCRRVCIDFKNVVSDMFYIIAPLISYDKNLNRLGFGKGWYDKTVFMLRNKNKTVKLIGVAYKEQYCDSIPKEPHDVPLDYLCVS